MGIVYVTTHLVMIICMISIFYWTFSSNEAISDQERSAAINRFYTRAVKLLLVIGTTGYRIVASVLISYLK